MRKLLFATLLLIGSFSAAVAADDADPLIAGWRQPPTSARLRSYWWWINGNVTKAAITRDLEEMKAKGFGGALLCDAGGSEQDGNEKVPHGPTFFSPEWRELYKHTLKEADRLGLEIGLSVQSGWNLGGPIVKPEEASKLYVWSESHVTGPSKCDQLLPAPKKNLDYYREIAVVAFPTPKVPATPYTVSASSSQPEHQASGAVDARAETFWVSGKSQAWSGPAPEHPEWLQFKFNTKTEVAGIKVSGRPGYGPRDVEIQVSENGKAFRTVKKASLKNGENATLSFDKAKVAAVRLVVLSAYDPRFPNHARNVQVSEVALLDSHGKVITGRQPIHMLDLKTAAREFGGSAPDCRPLLADFPERKGEEDCKRTEVLDLSKNMAADGKLTWDVPPGNWTILRFGYTVSGAKVSTCSDGWEGLALDHLDPNAFKSYWQQIIAPLIQDAGPLAGTTLKYLHTDSWEVGGANWTPKFREEFRKRRGYDLIRYLPVLAGKIVESRPVSNRFLHDFRKTVGDCIAENHYMLMSKMAKQHGIGIHPESGGPHGAPIDSLRNLGISDIPMSEFWARSWRHRVGDVNRFFVKQPASAAHTYGHRVVAAEGFTTIGPHWQETLWDNLKPSFDQAACEGFNLLVWHAFTCSPAEMGLPGQEYFAGTHFNPNATWWNKSAPFLAYINRCQFMLQQGLFVADACYYYGDNVPNFAQLKSADPTGVLPGYDYDVATEEVVLKRMSVKNGRIELPDGLSYRVLVLPEQNGISLPVLRKVKELVQAGATVIGPKPATATGLNKHSDADKEVKAIAEELWGTAASGTEHKCGKGRVFTGNAAREVLAKDKVQGDFEALRVKPEDHFDYIHRQNGDADIYFVANLTNTFAEIDGAFRVIGKTPELWDPVSGEVRPARAWSQNSGRTIVPLEFNPYGSIFVVFRTPGKPEDSRTKRNFPTYTPVQELRGPWSVQFDPKWGGPESTQFTDLVSWTARPEEGIKYYSGTGVYRMTFDLQNVTLSPGNRLFLDLGDVKNLAEVRLNGKNIGVAWTFPFRVDITSAVKPTENILAIEVVNFWPNRVIGDQFLPEEKRFTRTNIRKLTKDTPLVDSGLLGPVRLLMAE